MLFLDDTPRGVLATRSPRHPNPIGLSVVHAAAGRVHGVRADARFDAR